MGPALVHKRRQKERFIRVIKVGFGLLLRAGNEFALVI
jgi:hypothetical protein